MSKDANFGLRLVVQRCSGQKWMIRNWIKHPRHWSQRTAWDSVSSCSWISNIGHFRGERNWCVVFYTTDCTELPSGYRAFQHWVLRKNVIYSSVLLSRAFTGTLRQAVLLAHISKIQLHVQNNETRQLSAARDGGLRLHWFFRFYCKLKHYHPWRWERVCLCVLLFFFAHLSKSKDMTAINCHIVMVIAGCDLENCSEHFLPPWQDM